MGADRQAPGPQGRGPFDANDAFVLPDGRKYVPGDACSDDIYGERLQLCCMSEQACPRVTQRPHCAGMRCLLPSCVALRLSVCALCAWCATQ
jgi:hypothetical protein